jgi:hypothetical protein
MRTSLRVALPALVLLLVGALLPTSAGARAATVTHRFWVIEHNLAGGTHFRGSPAALTYVDRENDSLAKSTGHRADMIALAEVCYSQYTFLKREHPGWHVWFIKAMDHQDLCGHKDSNGRGEPQGQVLASRWNVVPHTKTATNLGGGFTDNPGTKKARKHTYLLGCMDVSVDVRPGSAIDYRRVHVCVAHLRPGGSKTATVRDAQLHNMSSTLAAVVARTHRAVVVAGDFNARPTDPGLNAMYDFAGGKGIFREGDQTDRTACPSGPCRGGEMTLPNHRAKIDYAFFSDNHATGALAGDARYLGASTACHDLSNWSKSYCSDHRLYRAYADLTFPGR